MGMAAGPSKGFKNEINVTPLVDVVLVLLIIFMVVTPMLQRGKDVKLPQAKQIEEEKKDADPMILSVTLEKTTWVENDQYDETGLGERLTQEFIKSPGRKVLVKGDNRLTFGDVRKVMEIARKSGAKSVGLAVEELKE
ncbi:ExbD/TolR family protein [Chondromyces apiculatus]|uniref:Biopolymer transport protein ExbD/TolR n=1 Tax=Chondromyces apiculatus DSM 436 TaxID=1192034 RepID=A0A017T385_9BACT|nr:biopolymer transporter ExbD [Chondromyces apiculatus]EYF03709.1 Biopolymer transport protein ExbD/TolR [Chondromyces apiculatus DSM 436]